MLIFDVLKGKLVGWFPSAGYFGFFVLAVSLRNWLTDSLQFLWWFWERRHFWRKQPSWLPKQKWEPPAWTNLSNVVPTALEGKLIRRVCAARIPFFLLPKSNQFRTVRIPRHSGKKHDQTGDLVNIALVWQDQCKRHQDASILIAMDTDHWTSQNKYDKTCESFSWQGHGNGKCENKIRYFCSWLWQCVQSTISNMRRNNPYNVSRSRYWDRYIAVSGYSWSS